MSVIFNYMKTTTYEVSGLTCDGCVSRVKNTLADYAENVEVTLKPPEATLTNARRDIHVLNTALRQVGKYQLSTFKEEPSTTINTEETKSWLATYKPLLLVFAYILLATIVVEVAHGDFVLSRWMPHFMAGFFLVFSFFKLLDLAGFASSYAMYDLLAKRIPAYGYIYPFIELGLGVWYLLGWQPILVNWLTLIVMGFSTIGVILAVMNKQKIRCACLGSGFNLPMSTVTIIEDLTMVAMAIWMLVN
ncbi:MAG: heavy-metal-associated domain-containing protein [Methylophilaceae bacterium]